MDFMFALKRNGAR